MPESADPDLILRVRRKTLADGRSALEFEAKARDPRLDLYFRPFDSDPFDEDPKIHFQELLSEIDQMPQGGSEGWLEGRGIQLFEELIPVELQRRLWALQGEVRTIQILSDETWIPWELLKLQDPDDPSASGPFLVEAFSLTRWLLEVPLLVMDFPLRQIALVIPKDSGLPMSQVEGEGLKALAGDAHEIVEIPATLQGVKRALASGIYGGWHFTGHGLAWIGSTHRWSIHLEDREELSSPHLTGPARRLGNGRPLIFLNACHTGRGAPSLTGMGGLASAFLKAGAGAFVGSLWSLDDEQACCFSEDFYRHLFSRMEIGEAVRKARLALREKFPHSNNWLAYTVFAHPLACCPAPVEPVPPVTPGWSICTAWRSAVPVEPALSVEPVPVQRVIEIRPPEQAPEPLPGEPTTQGRLYTLSEISQRTGISMPTLQRYKKLYRDRIPAEGKGRKKRHPDSALPTRGEPPAPPPGAERINEKDGTVLLYVPGGELTLGAKDVHSWSKPIHRVHLSPFWIGKFLVTNEQYSRFLQENANHPTPAFWEDSRFNGPQHPVVGVSWEEAQAYCRWAGLELPSEARWEAAARGADERPYPWGREPPAPRHANFGGMSGGTTPVGKYPAGQGPYGTLDQAGNVWEWCVDPWSANAYQLIVDGQLDPVARGDKAVRSLRGGSWNNPAQDLRAAYRDRGTAKLRLNSQGFRCVWRPA